MKELWNTIRGSMAPVHPDGWKFIAAFAIVSILLGMLADILLFVGLLLTLWCVYFFRDPKRSVPSREGLILSPADGVVQKIERVKPPAELGFGEEERPRISIFLNVFNVHVNRVPATGVITATHYHKGAFFNASLDKASEENERQLIAMKTEGGAEIGFVQIAGLVARRILCHAKEGQAVSAGERYGLIRFGSRVDVYLPVDVNPLVTAGQTMIGGESVLADLKSSEETRESTVI